MMEWMRKSAPGIILVVVLVFGATTFVGYGVSEFGTGSGSQNVGSVGKDKISVVQFQNAYQRAEANTRDQEVSGADRRQLPMRVWEEIVSSKLGQKAAKMLKLEATSEEVLTSLLQNPPSFLLQNPYFADSTGKFSPAKYQQIMSMPETYASPEVRSIEEYTRSSIPNMKIAMLLEMANIASPSEIQEQYRRENEKVQFEYLVCRPYSMTVSPDKLSEKAVADYYKAHESKYKSEDKADLYFIKIVKKATAMDEVVITKQLTDIKTKIASGEATFAESAEFDSDDEQSIAPDAKGVSKGGVIGWLKKGDFTEFDSLFALPVGTITGPIKSRMGLHLVKIDSVSGAGDTMKVAFSHILKKITPTVETLDSLDSLGAGVLKMAEAGDFKGAAAKFGLRLDSTGLIGRGDAVPSMGDFSELGKFVFENKKDTSVESFENDSTICVTKVKARFAAGVTPLANVAKDIRQILQDSLKLDAAVEYMNKTAAKINNGSLIAFAPSDTSLLSGQTALVSRNEFVAGVGYNNRVISAAFLTKDGTVSKPVREDNGVYLVRTLAHTAAAAITPDATKQTAAAMKAKRNGSMYQEWYMSFREMIGVKENVRHYFY